MYLTVKGRYKNGKIELLEKLEGIEEAEVLIVVTKEKRKKKTLTDELAEALKEVKLMKKGKIVAVSYTHLTLPTICSV